MRLSGDSADVTRYMNPGQDYAWHVKIIRNSGTTACTTTVRLSVPSGKAISFDLQTANGRLAERRRTQEQAWMWERIGAGLQQRFRAHAAVREALPRITDDVRAGRLAASVAARRLLDLMD